MASLLFWDWLWGIPGAFLSVPLLAVFKIVCDHVDSLTAIGHIGGGVSKPGRRRMAMPFPRAAGWRQAGSGAAASAVAIGSTRSIVVPWPGALHISSLPP